LGEKRETVWSLGRPEYSKMPRGKKQKNNRNQNRETPTKKKENHVRQRCGNLGNCPSKNFHQIGLPYNCTGLIYNKRHFNQVARAKSKKNGKNRMSYEFNHLKSLRKFH